jgi:site-specific DNA recombinase
MNKALDKTTKSVYIFFAMKIESSAKTKDKGRTMETKKAIGYVRVSTDEQAREGISLDAQVERIRALAIAKDWELVEIIEDKGFSGKNLERPGMEKLIESCRRKKANVAVVYKVDRLTRKQKDLWHLLEDVFDKNSVGLVSVTEPFDTTAAMGKAFLGMLGVFAQLERDMISERTTEALGEKRRQREWVGRVPAGFSINEKHLEEDPDVLGKLQKAKRLRRQGRSIRDISGALDIPKSTLHRLLNVNLRTLKSRYLNNLA